MGHHAFQAKSFAGLRTPQSATETRDGRTRNFPKHAKNKKAPKIGPRENTPKIPKNTPNVRLCYFGGIFLVFSGCLLGGDPEFWAGGYFCGVFVVEISVSRHLGSSVAGRGVLNSRQINRRSSGMFRLLLGG